MRFEIEIPDEWIKNGRQWTSSQILTCSQCNYKTPLAAMFVAHVFNEHGTARPEEDDTLVLDK